MRTIYVPRRNVSLATKLGIKELDLAGCAWGEVWTSGLPVPPRFIKDRVETLLRTADFATYSDVVLSAIGFHVRHGLIKPTELDILFEGPDKNWERIPIDIEGQFIRPLPYGDDEADCDPTQIGFRLRYS